MVVQRHRRVPRAPDPVTVAAISTLGTTPTLRPPPPVLSVRDVSKRFGGGCPRCVDATGEAVGSNRCRWCGAIVAVHGVSFDVGPREVIGVVGESGSGKSTLLRCLHRDLDPETGTVVVDGVGDLLRSSRPISELRTSVVVMVHQNALAAGMYPGLAAESNVAERLLAAGSRSFGTVHDAVGDLLAVMEVESDRHSDPLETFSGGMQQRVQLARALVAPPPVLLLDEPTTGLDPSVQAGLLDIVQRVTDEIAAATVVVSHDIAVIRVLASRVLVLHHGRVVEDGITEQVFEDPEHPYTQLLVASRLS